MRGRSEGAAVEVLPEEGTAVGHRLEVPSKVQCAFIALTETERERCCGPSKLSVFDHHQRALSVFCHCQQMYLEAEVIVGWRSIIDGLAADLVNLRKENSMIFQELVLNN